MRVAFTASALLLFFTAGQGLAEESTWRLRSSARQRADLERRLARDHEFFRRISDDELARASLRNLASARQTALLDLLATVSLPPRLQPVAWEALALLGRDRELDMLSQLVSGLGPRTPAPAVSRLRALAHELPAAERSLIELLRRSAGASPPLARSCLESLGETGTGACVEVLCGYLTEQPYRQAFLSIAPLLAVGSRGHAERVADALSARLERKVDGINRGYAHHVLGELGHPAALNTLFGYVDDTLHTQPVIDDGAPLPRDLDSALVAIGEIGTPLAIEFLLDRGHGSWAGVAITARCIEALARSRTGAREAELVESLVDWLGETDDPRIQAALASSLRALTGQRFPSSAFVWQAYLERRGHLLNSEPDALEDGVWAIGWKRRRPRAGGAPAAIAGRWNDGLARAREQGGARPAGSAAPPPVRELSTGYAIPGLAMLLLAGGVLSRTLRRRGACPSDPHRFFELLDQLGDEPAHEPTDDSSAAPTRSGWTERVRRLAAGLAPTLSGGGDSFSAAPRMDLSQASCPRCNAIGLTQVAELSVAADGCDDCGGLLIRETDLAFYVALEVDAAPAGGALLDLLRGASEGAQGVRSRQSCPCCQQPFTRLALDGSPVVLLERCAQHGVWLNRKKLPRLAHSAGRHAVAKGLLTVYVEPEFETGEASFLPSKPQEERELGAVTAVIQQAQLSEPAAIDAEAANRWAEIAAELTADADALYAEYQHLPRREYTELHAQAWELVPADLTLGTPAFDDALRARVVALMRERRSAQATGSELGAVAG